ncbi:hypothetical protein D918_01878 [Trichuris suis]|nr:hypothetical protein D918_01878 [Trichuris suis]
MSSVCNQSLDNKASATGEGEEEEEDRNREAKSDSSFATTSSSSDRKMDMHLELNNSQVESNNQMAAYLKTPMSPSRTGQHNSRAATLYIFS